MPFNNVMFINMLYPGVGARRRCRRQSLGQARWLRHRLCAGAGAAFKKKRKSSKKKDCYR